MMADRLYVEVLFSIIDRNPEGVDAYLEEGLSFNSIRPEKASQHVSRIGRKRPWPVVVLPEYYEEILNGLC